MKCPQCSFHNLPQLTVCGRCGSALSGGGVALADVMPPRASQRQTRWRKLGYKWNDRWGSFKERLPSGRMSFALDGDVDASHVPFWTLWIPGLSHRWLGFPIRAGVFFWSWLLLLAYGVFAVGLPFAATATGLAFSVHVSCVLDLFVGQIDQLFRRIAAILTVAFAVFIGVYYPAYWLVSHAALPVEFARDYGPFEAGDTGLCLPSRGLAPGDVVAVWMSRAGAWTRQAELATVLGLEGDEVRGEHGVIRVNGEPLRFHAMNQVAALRESFQRSVPSDRVLVVLSELRLVGGVVQRGTYGIVEMERRDIAGRISYVAGPWSRRGWIARKEAVP